MADVKAPSGVEKIKEESVYLKGSLVEELADTSTGEISDAAYELMKFHGSYFGYDRDSATERKKAKLDKLWEFMIRMKCPAGRLTPTQYAALDKIAGDYANGTLRITTRQTFQFHCIVKANVKKHIAAINHTLLSTLGGCGDVVRNIMACPAPIKDIKHERLLADALLLAEHCAPKTSAYHEIWLDGENVARTPDNENVEPLYGKHYLPRKFKIALAVPEDNTVDALTHDLAFFLIYEGKTLKGYNVYMGGGLGMTHNKPETYARLASPIAFVNADQLVRATEAVVKLQRDHGDRSDRKHARLKYVVQENGLEWTRKTLEEYFGEKMQDPVAMPEIRVVDHMGWHEQGDGKLYLGIPISSGRIENRGDEKIRDGLLAVITKYQTPIILTADQNIILGDIDPAQKQAIAADLRSYGIKLREDITSVDRNMLACVALPTCGKALAEAERIRLPLLDEIEKVMRKNGIIDEPISIRIAGCPNGCSRPYVGEISIVGRTPENYALFAGGDFEGTRLSDKLLDRVPYDKLPDVLDVMFAQYVAGRKTGEAYGVFAHRITPAAIKARIVEKLGGEHKWAA